MSTQKILKKVKRRLFGVKNDELHQPRKRLVIQIAKWKDNVDSPVILMIDDLTNAWVQLPKTKDVHPKGDWGGRLNHTNSIFTFLEKKLYSDYPEVRTTFFTVISEISKYNHQQPFTFAKPINYNKDSIEFFRGIHEDPRFEIAYHGFNHGKPGNRTEDFIQEFESFESLADAMQQTRKGLEIYEKVFNKPPCGGKYGGWRYNQFADKCIDMCGFNYWCRDWMPKDTTQKTIAEYFETQIFGKNRIIALPTTIHGRHWTKKQIEHLLTDRQIISIEEHMGCWRPDNRIQTPNVYHDIDNIKGIYRILKDKKVWHATAAEVASYARCYLETEVTEVDVDSFVLNVSEKANHGKLTIIIQPIFDIKDKISTGILTHPDGSQTESRNSIGKNYFLFNISLKSGKYKLKVI